MAYQVGDKAKLGEFATIETNEQDEVRLTGEFAFVPPADHPKGLLARIIFGARFLEGGMALGITQIDESVTVLRIADREEDAEGWVLDSAGFEDGQEVLLTEVQFTRVF